MLYSFVFISFFVGAVARHGICVLQRASRHFFCMLVNSFICCSVFERAFNGRCCWSVNRSANQPFISFFIVFYQPSSLGRWPSYAGSERLHRSFFSGWVLRPALCSGRQVIAGVIYILRHFVRLCVYDRERCFRLTRLLLCSGAASSSEELWHQAINLSERCIRIDLVRDTAVDSGVASSRLSPHSTDKVKRIAEPLDMHFVHLFIDTSVQNVTDKNSDRWQLGMLVIPFFGKPDFCCWRPIWNQCSVLLTFIEI